MWSGRYRAIPDRWPRPRQKRKPHRTRCARSALTPAGKMNREIAGVFRNEALTATWRAFPAVLAMERAWLENPPRVARTMFQFYAVGLDIKAGQFVRGQRVELLSNG